MSLLDATFEDNPLVSRDRRLLLIPVERVPLEQGFLALVVEAQHHVGRKDIVSPGYVLPNDMDAKTNSCSPGGGPTCMFFKTHVLRMLMELFQSSVGGDLQNSSRKIRIAVGY